jgi:hypothetical protein
MALSIGVSMILTYTAPTRALSENESRRLHWASRKRRLDPWALVTAAAWRSADDAERDTLSGKRIAVHVSIGFPRGGRRDPHNYVGTVVKTIVDALVRAGMCEDDTPDYIEVREPKLKVDKTEQVMIFLEPLEERKI